jgi:hypothetical protein
VAKTEEEQLIKEESNKNAGESALTHKTRVLQCGL